MEFVCELRQERLRRIEIDEAREARRSDGEGAWVEGHPLVRQPGGAERLAQGGGKRRRAIHAGKLPAVTERRLQLQNTCRRRPGFVQPPELHERRRQQHVIYAVSRIGLDGPVRRIGSLAVAAAQEMPHCERTESRKGPGIERAKPYPALAPFDRAFGVSGPSENDAAKDVGESR